MISGFGKKIVLIYANNNFINRSYTKSTYRPNYQQIENLPMRKKFMQDYSLRQTSVSYDVGNMKRHKGHK